jgi:hypothetical protein
MIDLSNVTVIIEIFIISEKRFDDVAKAQKSMSLTELPSGYGQSFKTIQLHNVEGPNYDMRDPKKPKLLYEIVVEDDEEFEQRIAKLKEDNWQITYY